MKYLVQCKCREWLFGDVPATKAAQTSCSSCGRVMNVDFNHVLADVSPTMTLRHADEFAADDRALTESVASCVKGQVDGDDDKERFVVMSSGIRFQCFSGLLVTEDRQGVLEHIGIYKDGKSVRGLWCHQASQFLQYHSRSSSMIYSRGMISGVASSVSEYHGGAVATNLTFEKLFRRLLRRFQVPAAVKRRRCVHERPTIDSMG